MEPLNISPPAVSVYSLAMDPFHPSSPLCGDRREGFLRVLTKVVRGKVLGCPASSVTRIVTDPGDSKTLYVIADSVVYRSTDGGMNWVAKSPGMTHGIADVLIIDPGEPIHSLRGKLQGCFQEHRRRRELDDYQ